jgi:drug/metabolite transporter (DMT)-like permease
MDKKLKSVLIALFVTFLWSTSWILIKIGLVDIPALPFAGLRYLFASIILFIYMIFTRKTHLISSLTKAQWKSLLIYGFILITLTQGTQFLALSMLPAVTLSLFLNMSPIFVLFLGFFFLKETINRVQLIGILLFFFGIIIYFYQVDLGKQSAWLGTCRFRSWYQRDCGGLWSKHQCEKRYRSDGHHSGDNRIWKYIPTYWAELRFKECRS